MARAIVAVSMPGADERPVELPTPQDVNDLELDAVVLVERMVERDEHALKLLMEQYARILYPLGRRVLTPHGTPEDVEELLSDTFLRAWRDSTSYDSDRGTVRAWLSWLLIAQGLPRRRSMQRFHNLRQMLARTSVTTVSGRTDSDTEQIHIEHDLERVFDALQSISSSDVDIIVRRFLYDQSPAAIAQDLDISSNAARVRIHRALQRMRHLIEAVNEATSSVD